MTPRLQELAAKYGVETHTAAYDDPNYPLGYDKPRPDVVIAMELLAKLRTGYTYRLVCWPPDNEWYWQTNDCDGYGTFIDAVIALAERQEGI